MSLLCVAIFVKSIEQARGDIARAAEAGADLVELRIDSFTDADRLREIFAAAIVPAIVTNRPVWEGGQSEAGNEDRLSLLAQAVDAGAEHVDLELKTCQQSPELIGSIKSSRIISSHDFSGRPARLANLLLELAASRGQISKIVWTARTIRDNLEAFEILQHQTRPTIALCMGEAGLISRVLAKKFGSFLTFAALSDGTETAAGQISIDDMKRLYRWDAIDRDTKVYGVVACPVAHSMSPAIHNAAFAHVDHNGVYLPMLVEGSYESFKAFMESFLHFPGLNLSGLSITIPHKQNALRYLQEKGADIEPLAQAISAVNTIVIETGTGKLRGINSDYAAILDSITAALGIERSGLAGRRVAVLGAGGTGRTAVAALANCGATVVVYNRTLDRAIALAEEFNGRNGKVVAAAWDKLCDSCCQIYLNTTSIGMSPGVDESPFGDALPKLSRETLVFDAVYNPMETKLIRQAKQAGAKTVGGVEMFVRQAATQFTAWTNRPAPVDVMRAVIEKRLGK